MIALAKNRLPWKHLTQSLHDPHVFQLNIGRNLRSAHLVVMQSADPAVSYAVILRPVYGTVLDAKIKLWAADTLRDHFARCGAGQRHEVRPLHVSECGHLCNLRTEGERWKERYWKSYPAGEIFVTSYDADLED